MDKIDRHIIRLLRTDGRISNQSLAEAVGLSPSACLRRVRILEKSGVIRGYVAVVGLPEEDEATVAIVRITLEKQTEEYLRRFESAVRRHPEIRECYLMTGDADYSIRVATGSAAAYEELHTNVLSRLPGVARIHSSIAMRKVLPGGALTSRNFTP
ncbi:DNA-binding Lrp family transcriptional regulator [Sphingobium sp. B11D3B]|uniref:Lrp/AsnC family transcriptional regulator n=1 Tax=Sphingobium sp. B11D3B TaxID=2940575 RepID=UPI002227309A|nr:Lrp/AsnC family transcriptional regulator [Sphingobium sp. B11D3B]MCW2387314.1 DNA-binding Lrp family transcriptional regulator [Sphingobium sp. B11D3B]